MARRAALLLIILLCVSCAKVKEVPTPAPSQETLPDCHEAWVYAPANYIIELGAGAIVTLDPARWDFPLFCSANEAGLALDAEIAAQRLPQGNWALYRLDGDYSALARIRDKQVLLLTKARLMDWQTWPPKRR